jgi:hypothetical protein
MGPSEKIARLRVAELIAALIADSGSNHLTPVGHAGHLTVA